MPITTRGAVRSRSDGHRVSTTSARARSAAGLASRSRRNRSGSGEGTELSCPVTGRSPAARDPGIAQPRRQEPRRVGVLVAHLRHLRAGTATGARTTRCVRHDPDLGGSPRPRAPATVPPSARCRPARLRRVAARSAQVVHRAHQLGEISYRRVARHSELGRSQRVPVEVGDGVAAVPAKDLPHVQVAVDAHGRWRRRPRRTRRTRHGSDPPAPQPFAFLAGGEGERFIQRHLGADLPRCRTSLGDRRRPPGQEGRSRRWPAPRAGHQPGSPTATAGSKARGVARLAGEPAEQQVEVPLPTVASTRQERGRGRHHHGRAVVAVPRDGPERGGHRPNPTAARCAGRSSAGCGHRARSWGRP